MTVGNVTASRQAFVALASSDGDHSTCTSVSEQLAVLVLNQQEQQKQIHHEELASARQDYQASLSNEVSALRDQADAQFTGALVQSGLTALSSYYGISSAVDGDKLEGEVSKAYGGLAQPLGNLVASNHGAADAKSAEGQMATAKDRIDDARDALKNADTLQNKATDWVSSMIDRDAATTSAILANKA